MTKPAMRYHVVTEVRKVRDQLDEEIKDLTPEEQVAYIHERAATFRREQGYKDKPI